MQVHIILSCNWCRAKPRFSFPVCPPLDGKHCEMKKLSLIFAVTLSKNRNNLMQAFPWIIFVIDTDREISFSSEEFWYAAIEKTWSNEKYQAKTFCSLISISSFTSPKLIHKSAWVVSIENWLDSWIYFARIFLHESLNELSLNFGVALKSLQLT